MSGYLIDNESIPAGKLLSPSCRSLTPEHIAQAAELSEFAATEPEQWQTYLTAVALLGVEEWLQERAPELTFCSDWVNRGVLRSRPASSVTDLAGAIAALQVGEFKLHLIALDDVQDSLIPIPKQAMDQPESMPHFYVLVEVLEDVEELCVYGFLRQDQVQNHRQSYALRSLDETTCLVPLNWFEPDLNQLLLYLRCLEPTAISLPRPHPIAAVTQRALNAGTWLQEQLDAIGQELGWVLLPPLAINPAMRGTRLADEAFETLLTELVQRESIPIPPNARAAYRDLQWENLSLRLYATAWSLTPSNTNAEAAPEWSLLLVLGTQTGTSLPSGLRLQVRDATQVLENPVITDRSPGYLHARVIGEPNEAFWVTISLPNGAALTLPPFTFSPNLLP